MNTMTDRTIVIAVWPPYKATHISRLDGSDAMCRMEFPFTLMNENGDMWTDTPNDWEKIDA